VTERIAIVTGSARGIGAATARRLAADGMAVAVLDLDEAACAGTVKEIADAGGRALAVGADVSDGDQVRAALERVAAELGEPTVLVNNRGQVNYSAAKAGLQGFTKTLAIELGQFGITANAVAPGFIATDMTAATAERVGVSFDVFQKAAAERIPVRRIGQPSDVAHTISFLVSDDAGFVSGQVIYVAGGPLC
jgi:3-oxoacyl-[acyl-carrier protein] reductase